MNYRGMTGYRINDLAALTAVAKGLYSIDADAGKMYNKAGKEVVGSLKSGYLFVTISLGGVEYQMPKHRFIYMAHHGLKAMDLTGKMEVDHINGDKLDNSIQNLRLVTGQENSLNPNTLMKGEDVPAAKITNATAEVIRLQYITGGFTTRLLSQIHGITPQAIQAILKNESYQSNTPAAKEAAAAIKNWRQHHKEHSVPQEA